jgi:O-antigen/teichoic acid export membrane protein
MPPHDLGRKSLLLLGSTWGSTALGMVVSVLIGRVLGPAALGSIGFSTGMVGLLMAALMPGFARAHLKRLSEGQDAGRCVGTMAAIQLALQVVLVVGLLALHYQIAPRWPWLAHASEVSVVFLFLLAAQVANNFADVFLKVFVVREWVVPHTLLVMAARFARLLATLAVLIWIPRIEWVAATFLLEGVLSGVGAVGLLAWRYHIAPRRPTGQSLLDYWRYARPFLVNHPLALFQDSIDRVLVGRWAGLTATGYYHVARGLWEALSSVIAAPATFLFTRLSSLYVERSPARDREARDFFVSGLEKLLFMTIPLAFAFWAFADLGIGLLLGPAFLPAALPLRLLVLTAIVANIVNPYTLILYALDEAGRFIPVNVVRIVVYVAALALLVPPDGLMAGLPGPWPGAPGAACARLVLVLVPCWIYFRWSRDVAAIPFHRGIWAYLGGFALMVGAFHAAEAGAATLGLTGWWAAVPSAALALALYLAYLFRVHPGTRENLRYTLALSSPTDFIRFLRSGLRGPARP